MNIFAFRNSFIIPPRESLREMKQEIKEEQ